MERNEGGQRHTQNAPLYHTSLYIYGVVVEPATMGSRYSLPCQSATSEPGHHRAQSLSPPSGCFPYLANYRSRNPHRAEEQAQQAQRFPAGAVTPNCTVSNRPRPSRLTGQGQQQQVQQPPDPSRHIPLELLLLCAQHLPANDVTCTIRALCREAHAALSPDPRHRTARLDAPLPPHVAAWSPKALDNACGPFASLSFVRKLSLPAVAAATGSTANLELAWRLVRPCLCPELPLRHYTLLIPERADAGVAAARAGRPDMVVWLVERRCPLVPARAARAAAVHCSLAGLREAWGALLRLDPGLGAEAEACWREVRKAADDGLVGSSGAGSSGGRGCEEVQGKGAWLYAQHQDYQARLLQWRRLAQQQASRQQQTTGLQAPDGNAGPSAAGANSHGRLAVNNGGSGSGSGSSSSSRVNGNGCGSNVHGSQHRVSHVIRDMFGCCLVPPPSEDSGRQQPVLPRPPRSWQWQQRRQASGLGAAGQGCCFRCLAACVEFVEWVPPSERLRLAAWAGDVDAVHRIRMEHQQQQQQQQQQGINGGDGGGQGGVQWWAAGTAFEEALKSGHIVAARTLLQAGYQPKDYCYDTAAEAGSLPILRWLLLEARPCPFGAIQDSWSLLNRWPVATNAEEERETMEVLQVLAEAGCTGGSSLLTAAVRRGSVPLLLEALRLAPPDSYGTDWGSNGQRQRLSLSLLSKLAEAGASAGLELCLAGVPRVRLAYLLYYCGEAWAQAAWRGDMATLECLRRLQVPWVSRELDTALRNKYYWDVPLFIAPVTVPVLRWAVEEAGCWELGAEECRRLGGGVEAALRSTADRAAGQTWLVPDSGVCEVAERGEWGWSSWPRHEVYVQEMEAVGAWLKARAERLERAEQQRGREEERKG